MPAPVRVALVQSGLVTLEEGLRRFGHGLNAVALSYVAATLTTVLQLLYFALRPGLF
jgi:Zn-dependent membrane protease YugP